MKTSVRRRSADQYQVGGSFYNKPIQHWNFVIANNIPYMEAQIMKYVFRWREKGGLSDLKKAQHFLDKLIEVSKDFTPSRPRVVK